MGPKKYWGQNFLRNQGAADRIVAAIEPAEDEIVLEIGPGEGALTEKLAALGRKTMAIEIDPELVARLGERFAGRIEIVQGDAVEAPLPELPYRAAGNLPYNAGTPILRRIITDPNCRRAVFMLQKEVADRLVAKPDSEAYGYLTLYTALFASARVLMTLDPGSFFPRPKVRSAVVVLDPRPPAIASEREVLLDLISASFRMRRKQLVNNLTGWHGLPRGDVLEAMKLAGIGPNARAETLALEDFDRLAIWTAAARRRFE
ncbi:MAG TPA: 16S rRNA (adenine(1518)-N(6)/adenine(1519)-N(6))-dimethyltransferase RsmA [Thermoanaerobaculia bacterium]|nr:16S rRNA (adenine(1518)-N(6)/adenine(1519)-N(6))-dimethyltransferase RsmA [Thermoanaerobaculia bacterium]